MLSSQDLLARALLRDGHGPVERPLRLFDEVAVGLDRLIAENPENRLIAENPENWRLRRARTSRAFWAVRALLQAARNADTPGKQKQLMQAARRHDQARRAILIERDDKAELGTGADKGIVADWEALGDAIEAVERETGRSRSP